MIRAPADAPNMELTTRLLDRLLDVGRVIGVPKRVVLERAVIPPLIPLAEVVQWPDQALQRLVLKAYLKDLADQDRGGDPLPNTGESS